jgi:hypothetical protein
MNECLYCYSYDLNNYRHTSDRERSQVDPVRFGGFTPGRCLAPNMGNTLDGACVRAHAPHDMITMGTLAPHLMDMLLRPICA